MIRWEIMGILAVLHKHRNIETTPSRDGLLGVIQPPPPHLSIYIHALASIGLTVPSPRLMLPSSPRPVMAADPRSTVPAQYYSLHHRGAPRSAAVSIIISGAACIMSTAIVYYPSPRYVRCGDTHTHTRSSMTGIATSV